jgi:thioredoxin-like negative regulator of GroEL
MLKPVLEEIKDIDIFGVNVDTFPELAAQYDVFTLPTIIFFNQGKPKESLQGTHTKQQIESLYKS